MAVQTPGQLIESPDLDDDGHFDVERFPLPDAGDITDPYLRRVWSAVRAQFPGGEYLPDEEAEGEGTQAPTYPAVPQVKSLAYATKGEGEPCKQGETSASTGCQPAEGDAAKKPPADKKAAAKTQAKAIKGKLLAGQPLSGAELWAMPHVFKVLTTHDVAAIAKKVLGAVPDTLGGVAKTAYVNALLAAAKKEGGTQAPTPAPSAPPPKPKAPEVPKLGGLLAPLNPPDATTIKSKLQKGQPLSADELKAAPKLLKKLNTHTVANLLKKVMGALPTAPHGKQKKAYIDALIQHAKGGAKPAASSAPAKEPKWPDPIKVAQYLNTNPEVQKETVAAALDELGLSPADAHLSNNIHAIKTAIKNKYGDSVYIPASAVAKAGTALINEQSKQPPAPESKPQPPTSYFTGKDANGHCWVGGKMVTCEDLKQSLKTKLYSTSGVLKYVNAALEQAGLPDHDAEDLADELHDPGHTTIGDVYEKVAKYAHDQNLGPAADQVIADWQKLTQSMGESGKAPAAPNVPAAQAAPNVPPQPPTPPKPLDPVKFPDKPTDLTYVGEAGGSTGTKVMTDKDGNKFFVKTGANSEHVKSEFAADRIYETVGLLVPQGKLYTGDDGKPTKVTADTGGMNLQEVINPKNVDAGGKKPPQPGFTGKDTNGHCWVDGKMVTCEDLDKRQAALAELRKGFVADALLGNWDVAGMNFDNVKVLPDGRVVRIDNGGSLHFRATGKLKTGNQWKEEVTEIETMQDPYKAPQASKVFAGITAQEIAAQVQLLVANKDKILATEGLLPGVRQMLERRIDWLADHYGPPNPNKPKKTEAKHSIYAGKGADWPSVPPDPNNTYVVPAKDLGNVFFKDYGPNEARKSIDTSQYPKSFVNHMKKTIASLTPKERNWVKHYTDIYGAFNQQMRQCPETMDCLQGDNLEKAKAIESAIAKAGTFDTPVTVWRNTGLSVHDKAGKDFLAVLQHGLETGDDVRIPSITSTSVSPSVTMGGGNIKLEIKAKSGLWVQNISLHKSEKELLQGHNTRYRVVAIKNPEEMPGSNWGISANKIVILEEI